MIDFSSVLGDWYVEVVSMIGSCCDYVKCNLDVFVVYEMIEGEDFFEIEDFGEEFIKFLILLIVFVDEKIVVFVGSVVWDVVVD